MEAKLLIMEAPSRVLSYTPSFIHRVRFQRERKHAVTFRTFAAANDDVEPKPRADGIRSYTIREVRSLLLRQEDTIAFALLERARFCHNEKIYNQNAFSIVDFNDSLLDYMLKGTEKLHAQVGRYSNSDEVPFFPQELPQPLLIPLEFPRALHPVGDVINQNAELLYVYKSLISLITPQGDDGKYASAASCDIVLLQALSRRVHFGRFVAEAKFQMNTERHAPVIKAKDREGVMSFLADQELMDLVAADHLVSKLLGTQDQLNVREKVYQINPYVVGEIFEKWIIPLIKDVQFQYLLRRL